MFRRIPLIQVLHTVYCVSLCTSTAINAPQSDLGRRPSTVNELRSVHSFLLCSSIIRQCVSSHYKVMSFSRTSSLLAPRRFGASYPSPSKGSRRTLSKAFNFLTHDRLVPHSSSTSRLPSVRELKQQASHTSRLKDFRVSLKENIKKHVHYIPPEVADYVFYGMGSESGHAKTLSARKTSYAAIHMRIYLMVLHQLMKKKERKKLIQLIEQSHLTVPSARDWEEFTDHRTGDILPNLVYSDYVLRALERLAIARDHGYTHLNPSQYFIAVHMLDTSQVPSLHQWWESVGPLTKEELVQLSKGHAKTRRRLKDSSELVKNYGKSAVEDALCGYSVKDLETLSATFLKNAPGIMSRIERHHLFTQTILLSVNTLPDIRLLLGAQESFKIHFKGLWYINQRGSFYPTPPSAYDAWAHISTAEKRSYLPFGEKPQGCRSGSMAFLKTCQRDYGLTLMESRARLSELKDDQLAAINFPFPVSLFTTKHPIMQAYNRFFAAEAQKYGLVKADGKLRTNRLFGALMRFKWMHMSVEEWNAYQEEGSSQIFPLQPSKHLSLQRDGKDARVYWSSLAQQSENSRPDSDILKDLEGRDGETVSSVALKKKCSPPSRTSNTTHEFSTEKSAPPADLPELTVELGFLELPDS